MGGLGNQLFQIATFLAFSEKYGFNLSVDLCAFKAGSQHGGYRLKFLSLPNFEHSDRRSRGFQLLVKLINRFPAFSRKFNSIVHEKYFKYRFLHSGNGYFVGYWQNSAFFDCIQNDLKRWVVPEKISHSANVWRKEIGDHCSVALHVRRGDYLSDRALKNHGICSLDYYRNAISHINESISSPKFYVFSNDPDWVNENIISLFNEKNFSIVTSLTQEEDLWLMAQCKHNIIANSSFSWWGAYLANNTEQLVIAPTPWYDKKQRSSEDPCLEHWIRLEK
tara:strand:- start:1630 stop:2463 length:834 start_codon:yes stop_codon:yes gene_type:complete